MSNYQDQFGVKYRHLTEVSLSANAYITRKGRNSGEYIGADGLHNWTSVETIISVYFYAKTALKFDLLIKCEVFGKDVSQLQLTLDNTSHSVSVMGTEYHNFPVGSFEVKSSGYHKFDLKGVIKSGKFFGDVSHLIFGQSSTEEMITGIVANVDRSTPSLYLNYKTPTNEKIEYYYNEVNVVKGNDPLYTYFATIGFSHGYFGIQVNSDFERRILFSIWSPENSEHKVTEESKVKLVNKGNDVIVTHFDGEGTGAHAVLRHIWTTEQTYKLLVRGRPDPSDKSCSLYTGWIALEDGVWQLLATFKRPRPDEYLTQFFSFLEEFGADTGYLTRKVRFGNQWVCDSTGNWYEVTEANFSGNLSAQKKTRLDFEAGVESYQNQEHFYLKNGGFFEGKIPLNSHLLRKATKIKPNVDLNNLPQ